MEPKEQAEAREQGPIRPRGSWNPLDPIHRWLFPELNQFESARDRRAAWKQAYRGSWLLIGTILIASVGIQLAQGFASFLTHKFPAPFSNRWVTYLFSFGFVLAMQTAWMSVFAKRVRRGLRVELAKRGHRICVECGYDLRGQVEQRCPECGTPFDLTKPPYSLARIR